MAPLAIICDDPGRGGCASVARTLWRRLEIDRPKVLVTDLPGAPAGWFTDEERAGLPDRRVVSFPIDEKLHFRATFDIRRALDLLERMRPAQIMFHDSRALGSMLALKRAARHLAIPFSATQHLVRPDFDGCVPDARPGDLRWTGAARKLVFVSAENRDRFVQYRPDCAAKAIVIRNGVDAATAGWPDANAQAALRKAAQARDGEKLAVLVARLDHAKGQDVAVRALAQPGAARSPPWRLILVGADADGRQAKLQDLAASLGVASRVSFLGRRADARDLIRGADAILQIGRAEGLPLSLLEAMAEGAPIVATSAGGVAEAIDEKSALLFEAGKDARTAEAVAQSLERLFADPQLAACLGAEARRRFDEHYRAESMIGGYASLSAELSPVEPAQKRQGRRASTRCVRKPPFKIDFTRPGEGWRFLGGGWLAQESWGVMAGGDADLEIPIAADGALLRVTFFMQMPGRRPGRAIEVEGPGGARAIWRFFGAALNPKRTLVIPWGASDDFLRFRFRLVSPGVDMKRLAPAAPAAPLFGLRAIEVAPASAR